MAYPTDDFLNPANNPFKPVTQDDLKKIAAAINALALTGAGDVTGPASATSGNIASYSGTTGKVIADGGKAAASIVLGPASAVGDNIAVYDSTTGKLIKDGGQTIAQVITARSS